MAGVVAILFFAWMLGSLLDAVVAIGALVIVLKAAGAVIAKAPDLSGGAKK